DWGGALDDRELLTTRGSKSKRCVESGFRQIHRSRHVQLTVTGARGRSAQHDSETALIGQNDVAVGIQNAWVGAVAGTHGACTTLDGLDGSCSTQGARPERHRAGG